MAEVAWAARTKIQVKSAEQDYIAQKRKSDANIVRKCEKWTTKEDAALIRLFKKGLTYKEIAVQVKRSSAAVGHRLTRVDIWEAGKGKTM